MIISIISPSKIISLSLSQQQIQCPILFEIFSVSIRKFRREDSSPSPTPLLLILCFLNHLFLQFTLLLCKSLILFIIFINYTRGTTPINVNRSANISPFILRSRGASMLREGEKLTSNSQGLKEESMRMSQPKREKQLLRQGTFISHAWNMALSTLIMVLIIKSSMRSNI